MSKIGGVNPFGEQNVTQQLDSWAAALEAAVATLNRTLTELKQFQQKGGDDVEPGTAGRGDDRRTPGHVPE